MNKAILDTDIFSEIIKGLNQAVVTHAKTYRRAFGHDTIAAVTVLEIVQGYLRFTPGLSARRKGTRGERGQAPGPLALCPRSPGSSDVSQCPFSAPVANQAWSAVDEAQVGSSLSSAGEEAAEGDLMLTTRRTTR